MNFNKLLEIIHESAQISCSEYANKLKLAYKAIFDLDDSDFISVEQRDLMPPSYCHHYFSSNLEFVYKLKKYKVYHKLFHYKIPSKSIKATNKEEWDSFLKNMEEFDTIPLTDDLLKNKHIQIKTKVSIFQETDQVDKFGMSERQELAREEMYGSIKDVVERVKAIIDGRDDDQQDEEFVDPFVPSGKLIPV